jgi:glucose/arabinose dehydrogenase
VIVAAAVFTAAFAWAQPAAAAPPSGFQETVAYSGLTNPAAIAFAPAADGRIFIGEKGGIIKVYDGLGDSSPTTVADLRTEVYNFWDRGLLGLVADPQFPTRPYLYALYALDAVPGGSVPRWGSAGVTSDPCPTPPGPTSDGCVVTGRLARLTLNAGGVMTAKTNLITDWCQQYPSHSIGDLGFGADGALYVSGGDGASFTFTDWGQDGNPVNPCGDPPGGPGTALTPPTAEGGSLRSQDARTTSDPTSLDGSILRIDPDTGAGFPGNPFIGSSDANQRRIAAIGQRNPFRFTIRPGTDEVWSGDVGWNDWEEINRLVDPSDATADNFGWPCYEGVGRQGSYDGTNLNLCESLYSLGSVVAPYYSYDHADQVVGGEACPTGSSSISGLDFYTSGPFPDAYDGALFFADYSRSCMWVMLPGGNGLPNPSNIQTFNPGAAGPVDLEISPAGDVLYADLDGGTIRRIASTTGPPPPGGDLALNKPASASSSEGTGFEAGKANDGSSTTRWSSSFADNQWWQVDLGSAQQVNEVRLNWEDAYASRYLIQTSTDGTNFTQAADVTTTSAGPKATTFAARSARYVRVLGVTRATPYGISFWDASVFGPSGGNQPPTAVAAANPSSGPAPLSVALSASGSSDPDDAFGTLAFAWDADNDGQFDDGNQATLNWTYAAGTHTATVRVTDPDGAADTDAVTIQATQPGNTPPSATVSAPPGSFLWGVGDTVNFAGSATDAQETLPASAFDWELIINHCPSNCHQHSVQQFPDRTSGSFSAPDHEYPSSLLIRLTVTDSGGLTDVESVTIDPRTVNLTLASQPAGLQLGLNAATATAPFTRTLIEDSQNTVIAPTPQMLSGTTYTFGSWSDAGAASHNVTVDQSKTLTATFNAPPPSTDKALNQPATASSVEAAGLEAGKANDGSSTTRWSSSFADNQWWRVDLGRTRQVDRVTLNWEAAYASRYRIQTSTNGTTFTQAADVTITSPGVKTHTFAVRSARYVRIMGVTRATPYGISLWDASVFGPAD